MGREALLKNFADNAVPGILESATYQEYETFMAERRVLMARMVERYYGQL